MRTFSSQRFLAIYSGVLTIVFAVTVLCGFAASRSQSFDQLTVHRINFVEPDGTPTLDYLRSRRISRSVHARKRVSTAGPT